jgi:hypothetical protein
MNKEFIPYEQALALKELGFDEPCLACADKEDHYLKGDIRFNLAYCVYTPLFQQAFRFFREKYGLISYIHPLALLQDTKKWCYEITNFESSWDEDSDLHTLEEAETACLLELIEITKTK